MNRLDTHLHLAIPLWINQLTQVLRLVPFDVEGGFVADRTLLEFIVALFCG